MGEDMIDLATFDCVAGKDFDRGLTSGSLASFEARSPSFDGFGFGGLRSSLALLLLGGGETPLESDDKNADRFPRTSSA